MAFKSKDPQDNIGISHNAIATGTVIKGDITAETDVRLDGRIEGNIKCNGKIIVGPQGSVLGDITSVNTEVMGEVKGNINVEDTLSLKSNALVKGDVATKTIIIEPGAKFTGTCSMSDKNKTTAKPQQEQKTTKKED